MCCIAYVVQQLVYYGTVYAVPDIGVNMYLNTIIFAVAELIGYVLAGEKNFYKNKKIFK